MEIAFLNGIQALRHPLLDQFFSFYTSLGNRGEIWLFLIFFIFLVERRKKSSYLAFISLILSAVLVSLILKPLIMRPRPFVEKNMLLLIPEPTGSSFPSGHSASSMAVAVLFFLEEVRGKYWYLCAAFLMAFSRLYLYVHYPSDVLAGIMIGSLIALLVYRYQTFFQKPYQYLKRRLDK